MKDHNKLVKALRCKRDDCEGCDLAFFDKDEGWMCQYAAKDDDAAEAIEALQAQMPKRGEIVRCGECKYHMAETERTNPYCTKYHCMRADDWFCADGERKVQE
jgi:hypothetical protein